MSVRVESNDNARFLLPLAMLGAATAVALAIAGLPPVDLHSPFHRAGIMDPGCGGTRALRLAARGDIRGAFRWNPLGPLLLAGALAHVIRSIAGFATGRWLNLRIATDRRLWIIVVLAIVALETRQQSIAPMLMRKGY